VAMTLLNYNLFGALQRPRPYWPGALHHPNNSSVAIAVDTFAFPLRKWLVWT